MKMLTKEEIKDFEKEGLTKEEIKKVEESIEHFEKTGECYTLEEVKQHVDEKVFSKYMHHHV